MSYWVSDKAVCRTAQATNWSVNKPAHGIKSDQVRCGKMVKQSKYDKEDEDDGEDKI